MRHSLNEIEVLLRKAAVGAGYPYGLAEEIGEAGAWLCAHGQDGLSAGLSGLAAGPDVPMAAFGDDCTPVFVDAHVARSGPSAIDLLLSSGGAGGVRMASVDVPLLLVGLAGVAADIWKTAIGLRFSDGCIVRVGPVGLDISGPPPAAGSDVVLVRHGDTGSAINGPPPCDGFDVEDALWTEALALASRTYVPASEASRAKGAGAGNIDND